MGDTEQLALAWVIVVILALMVLIGLLIVILKGRGRIKFSRSSYMDPNEEPVAILGQSRVTSLLTGEGFSTRSIMVLTNRRLYMEAIAGFSFLVTSKVKKNVEVGKINSTAYVQRTAGFWKWFGYLNLVAGVLLGLLPYISDLDADATLWWPWLLVGLLSLAIYRRLMKKLFVVEFSGGSMVTNCNWCGNTEIEDFQRKICQQQERANSEV